MLSEITISYANICSQKLSSKAWRGPSVQSLSGKEGLEKHLEVDAKVTEPGLEHIIVFIRLSTPTGTTFARHSKVSAYLKAAFFFFFFFF